MTVKAAEFIQRFLLQVLPDRFVKIRHYGLLGNRCRKEKIAACRRFLACTPKEDNKTKETWQEALLRFTGIDVTKCRVCKEGKMRTNQTLQPTRCNGP